MNDTLSMLTGLLGGYGRNSGSSSRGYGGSDSLYSGTDTVQDENGNTTTKDLLAQAWQTHPDDIPAGFKKKKAQTAGLTDLTGTGTSIWDQKTQADDSLSGMRQYPEDSLVAHISPWEAELLSLLGGSGSVNKSTGLLQFGIDGGGGDGGGDNDSDGGGDSGSDSGGYGGGDSDSDSDGGGFNGGDRGMDAGSLGGEDRGGTGSSMDGSDYGGHGFSSSGGGNGGRGGSGLDGTDNFSAVKAMSPQQGPIGQKFQDAFRFADNPSMADQMGGMNQDQRGDFMSNAADLEGGPFGSYGLMRDAAPQSNARGMFSNAQAQQIVDGVNIGNVIDQGLKAYGLPDATENLAQQQAYVDPTVSMVTDPNQMYSGYPNAQMEKLFTTDWGKYNLTKQPGFSTENALNSDQFAGYVSNSPVAMGLLRSIASLADQGYDTTGMGITSGNDGIHAENSKHYSDQAVDANTKVNSKAYGALTSAMEGLGYNRGDKLGFGASERMHFQ